VIVKAANGKGVIRWFMGRHTMSGGTPFICVNSRVIAEHQPHSTPTHPPPPIGFSGAHSMERHYDIRQGFTTFVNGSPIWIRPRFLLISAQR
jgi:hypothetical protein